MNNFKRRHKSQIPTTPLDLANTELVDAIRAHGVLVWLADGTVSLFIDSANPAVIQNAIPSEERHPMGIMTETGDIFMTEVTLSEETALALRECLGPDAGLRNVVKGGKPLQNSHDANDAAYEHFQHHLPGAELHVTPRQKKAIPPTLDQCQIVISHHAAMMKTGVDQYMLFFDSLETAKDIQTKLNILLAPTPATTVNVGVNMPGYHNKYNGPKKFWGIPIPVSYANTLLQEGVINADALLGEGKIVSGFSYQKELREWAARTPKALARQEPPSQARLASEFGMSAESCLETMKKQGVVARLDNLHYKLLVFPDDAENTAARIHAFLKKTSGMHRGLMDKIIVTDQPPLHIEHEDETGRRTGYTALRLARAFSEQLMQEPELRASFTMLPQCSETELAGAVHAHFAHRAAELSLA